MQLRALFVVTSALLAAGCSRQPDAYPPPFQRHSLEQEARPLGRFVNMNDDNAGLYLVRDIQDSVEGTGWRWTHDHPELRFRLDRAKGLKFSVDFSFPEPNFRQTGPVTVTFLINGKPLGKVRYTKPGDQRFVKPVPEAWLSTSQDTLVRADVDPPWVAPADKARLGFVLYRAGFIE